MEENRIVAEEAAAQNPPEQAAAAAPHEEDGRLTAADMKKIASLLVLAALLVLALTHMDAIVGAIKAFVGMISPFLLGGALAFVLNVLMRPIEKGIFGGPKARASKRLRAMARPVSMILSLLIVAVLLALFGLVLVPQLTETVNNVVTSAQKFFPKAEEWLVTTFEDNPQLQDWINDLELDWRELGEKITAAVQSGVGTVVTSGVNAVVSLVNGLVNLFIGIIFACYILAQKEKLSSQIRRLLTALLPDKTAEAICRVATMSQVTFSNFVRGQCLEAVILGLMFVVAMSICGMPYVLLAGVVITVTALIPIFGAFIGCVVVALLILMTNPMQAVFFVVLFLILQQLEGNLIYPHVVGNSVGLPSIWVLVAFTIGGSLMGIVGMLIFIPLASVAYALLREWVNKRNAQKAAQTPVQEPTQE